MKKKLEAELISIAHRILKLKNKSELDQLLLETQKLYEKLAVLKFVEANFADAKPTIGQAEIEEKIEAAFQNVIEEEAQPEPATNSETPEEEKEAIAIPHSEAEEEAATDEEHEVEAVEEPVAEEPEELEEAIEEEAIEAITAESEPETEEETPEPETEEETVSEEKEEEPVAADTTFKPAFELSFDAHPEPVKEESKNTSPQIAFDDLLGADYVDPVFVKPEDLAKERAAAEPSNVIPIGRSYNDNAQVISINKDNVSLNDRLSKGIIIGLNDRIAFMNHLFNNSSEDYNRVLSQLITFDTFEEAQNFIDTIVKPDYNNWEGKDEYAERFMEIVERKFS